MAGDWDAGDGDLHGLLTVLRINLEADLHENFWLNALKMLLGSWNSVTAATATSATTTTWTNPCSAPAWTRTLHYSCAYFKNPDASLEDAQAAKCAHIAAKLRLAPGQRVLDIGSGWGSLALHLAERHGVSVTGLTLSTEQLRVAKQRALGARLGGPGGVPPAGLPRA